MPLPRGIVGGLLVLGLITGCSDSGDVDEPSLATEEDRKTTEAAERTTSSTTTTEPESATEAVRTYFDAIASGRARDVEEAMAVVEPSSPAELYLRYQAVQAEFAFDSGARATYDGDTIELCEIDFPDEPCSTFGDVRSNSGGQIVTFRVGDNELADRITTVGDPMTQGGVTLTPIAAYESIGGALWFVFDLTNDTGGEVISVNYRAVYVAADGRQFSSAGGMGLMDNLRPGATASDLIAFDRATRPGTITYEVYNADYMTAAKFEIPIP